MFLLADLESKSSIGLVFITIEDKNDNAPEKGTGWDPVVVCEKAHYSTPQNLSIITVTDKDSIKFSPVKLEIIDVLSPFTLKPSKVVCYLVY